MDEDTLCNVSHRFALRLCEAADPNNNVNVVLLPKEYQIMCEFIFKLFWIDIIVMNLVGKSIICCMTLSHL